MHSYIFWSAGQIWKMYIGNEKNMGSENSDYTLLPKDINIQRRANMC